MKTLARTVITMVRTVITMVRMVRMMKPVSSETQSTPTALRQTTQPPLPLAPPAVAAAVMRQTLSDERKTHTRRQATRPHRHHSPARVRTNCPQEPTRQQQMHLRDGDACGDCLVRVDAAPGQTVPARYRHHPPPPPAPAVPTVMALVVAAWRLGGGDKALGAQSSS